MARERLPDTHQTSQRRRSSTAVPGRGALSPPAPPRQSPTAILISTWPGRLFLTSASLKFLVAVWRAFAELPAPIRVVSTAASIGLAVAVFVFVWRLFVLMKRQLLWRVRRKLILSYIFIGVVPSLLIIVFFLFCSAVLFMGVAAYLFKSGYDKVVDDVKVVAQAAALEISRNPATAAQTVERVHRIRSRQYPALSVVYVAPDGETFRAGRWEHTPPPSQVPAWLKDDLFAGTLALPVNGSSDQAELVVRSAAKTGPAGKGIVIVDVPIDDQMIQYLHDQTAVRAGTVTTEEQAARARGTKRETAGTSYPSGVTLLWTKSVTQLDYRDWATGTPHRATLAISYRLGELYKQLASAQSFVLNGMLLADAILVVVVVIAILFLIIEAVALLMGLALAKSITSSVHELFTGTERVRHGDFTHRISIQSRDQLGELADSFNQMTGSIENLLQTAAEKKRLEEELRIARQIQMSLLPRGSLEFPGITVTALCVPAREVGGDYYDFFPLGDERLGVLIADVSGKGTSAALYMAELKGLVLSLSQIYQSPRQLLMEVNRIISENLDTRSFITMTYAVIDLAEGAMTFARAGHTPLMYLPGSNAGSEVQILTPSGIVVGLRIPGATEKFAELLEEDRVGLSRGDVVVLYTDGITEAMNAESDLFGEGRLGRLVAEHGHLESGELRERILREIEAFVGNADQHDDMTMILIKVERAFASEERLAV